MNMKCIYKLVQGEDELKNVVCRMKGKDAQMRFCESKGECDGLFARRFYARPKDNEGYKQFFLLYMERENGITGDVNEMELASIILIEGEDSRVTCIQQIKKNHRERYDRLIELSKHIRYEKV